MKAAVCHEFGAPLTIEDVSLRKPGPDEIAVSVRACGICQSDVHYIAGAWGGQLPAVFGHEVSGVIEELGPAVVGFEPGQRVSVGLVRACGTCFFCAIGQPALCETTFALDLQTPICDASGKPVGQGLRTGGFAEAVVVHSSQVVAIPDDLPFEAASVLACAVLTGFGAVVNTGDIAEGQSVVVIGTGGVGLNAVQAAAISGARPVIAVDIAPQKLQSARTFGATHGIDAREGSVESQVRELTGGRGADLVMVTAGAGTAVEQGLRMVRRAGTVVVVGMPGSGATSRLDVAQFAHDGQRILGSKMGSARPRVDIARLISLYRQGRLKLDELISGRFPLDRINEAITSSSRGEAIRNLIVFSP